MTDPLNLLRDYKMSGKQVSLNGDVLVFNEDGIQFPCSTPTSFRALGGDGEAYTLGACWFMLLHAEKSYPDYLGELKQNPHFQRVSLVDRKEMINYLTGVISSSKNIRDAPELPLPSSMPIDDSSTLRDSSSNKRSLASSTSTTTKTEEPEPKKQKLNEPQDIELDEKMRESKEEIAKRLEKPKVKALTTPATTAPVPELGAGMTADKINEIKRKIHKKKMATVGDIESSISEKTKVIHLMMSLMKVKTCIVRINPVLLKLMLPLLEESFLVRNCFQHVTVCFSATPNAFQI